MVFISLFEINVRSETFRGVYNECEPNGAEKGRNGWCLAERDEPEQPNVSVRGRRVVEWVHWDLSPSLDGILNQEIGNKSERAWCTETGENAGRAIP